MTNDPYRLIDTVLNEKFKLIEFAGSGGMGVVYRALSLANNETVAVKILRPDVVAKNPSIATLFEKEIENVQSLNHPHIVRILDSGRDLNLSYMVIEWIDGISMEDVISKEKFSLEEFASIFKQVCSAISYAHEKNILHLDIKPSNILLLERDRLDYRIKVIDFGLSRVISSESGTTATVYRGTPQYSPPEQFKGKLTQRSDIYSLGVTLYYLLAGVFPFGSTYIRAKMNSKLEMPEFLALPSHLGLPTAINQVIKKATNRDPNLRQQTANQMFDEFDAALPAKRTKDGHRNDAKIEQDTFVASRAVGDMRLAVSFKHGAEKHFREATTTMSFTMGLVNNSFQQTFSDYRIEMQISAQFINKDISYDDEVLERRNERYRYFRKENEKGRDILKPGERHESFFHIDLIIPPESVAMNDERQRIAVQVYADDDMTQSVVTIVRDLLHLLPASSD